MNSHPDEILAYHDTKPDFDDTFTGNQVLMVFLGGGAEGEKVTYFEDPNERYQAAKTYAEEHNTKVYTVDGDYGEIYYSKGFRFCNIINQGLYIVKVENLVVNNS